ncbi:acyltransferase family protein [Runella sp.]|uniref:acyltransferase family protein n=1 Tax=Runella sp. TaxID=1960881 RepID=UPI003D0B5EE1
MSPSKLPALTGLRAFAALLVYVHHYNPFPKSTFLHQLAQEGYVGVTVFFVLSSFLITWNYADKLRTTEERKRFYLFRFARITPLYWLLLTGYYLLQWFTKGKADGLEQLSNFLLIKGLIPSQVFSGIPQSWSLTVEVCFYALAPLWIFFVVERRWAALLLLYAFFGLGLVFFYKTALSFGSFYTLFGRFFEFGAGIYAALWLYKKQEVSDFQFKTATALLFSSILVIAYVLAIHYFHLLAFYTEWLLYNLLLPIAVGFGLVGLATEKSLLISVLSSSLFQTLGKASYAFYLIHIGPVAIVLQRYVSDNNLVLLILLWGVACGLYRWVERPVFKYLTGFSRKDAEEQRNISDFQ